MSDAVLAQVARRSPEAQRLLELVAVVPHRIPWGLVEAISAPTSRELAECLEVGILLQEGTSVGYRHELARQAVERALTPTRRRALHADVLRVLLERGVEQTSLAQLVHHAAEAEDGALVLRLAPAAASLATAQGAHRAAADHYRRALGYADLLEAAGQQEVQATLLDALADECALTGQTEEAFRACTAALALWRRLEQTAQMGHTLQRLSDHAWHLGRSGEASWYALEAVDLLEALPPSRELGQAYAHLASLYMVGNDTPQTLAWGRRAIEVAERCHDAETVCYALLCMGAITFCLDDERGRAMLEQSLQVAKAQGFENLVALAYANLAEIRIRRRAYAGATGYLEAGLAYCAEHELDALSHLLRPYRAWARLDQGDWAGAGEEATAILSVPGLAVTNRIPALLVLGLLRARRGDPGAEAVLEEARDLAVATGEMRYIAHGGRGTRGVVVAARQSRAVRSRGRRGLSGGLPLPTALVPG